MAHSERQLGKLAAAIIEECGENARVRALFTAITLRRSGDADDAALWTHIANIIAEIQSEAPHPNR